MKKSDQLKLERTAKVEAQGKLLSTAKSENRELTPEENTSFDALDSEIEGLDGSIARAIQFEKAELRAVEHSGKPVNTPEVVREEKPAPFSIHKIIRSQLPGGELTGSELETHKNTLREAQQNNIAISGIAIPLVNRATQQTVTGDSGAAGGNRVATDLNPTIEYLRPAPLLEMMGARFRTGLRGNQKYPVNQGGIIATWEGETDTTDPTANLYGSIESKPIRLTVTVPISLQSILQDNEDIELDTLNDIKLAVGNAIDLAGINGTGTGQPLGILNNTNVNVVATGTNGSAPTWDALVDMETAVFVENATAAKMNYLFNPKTRGKLKKTKHEAGDMNYLMGTDGNVNGYPSNISTHVPSNLTKGTGTALSAGLFGDFTQLLINQWGFMDISVDNTSQKKAGLVEVTVNVFVDVLVRQPKAFTKIVGLITT